MKIIRNILIILLACISITFADDFGYTGDVQTFTASVDGWYKLEVYGAQGGSGGNGGYSSGYVHLTARQNLYVVVGGQGASYGYQGNGSGVIPYGGYNGGGTGGRATGHAEYGGPRGGGGGGGATHIATTKRGVLSNYSSYKSEVLIVAGGGGGGANGSAGTGGGTSGGNSTGATGGSQSSGGTGYASGSFGQGAGGRNFNWVGAGGGGGGWYGGGSSGSAAGSNSDCGYSGAGGSGYIGGVTSFNGSSPTTRNGDRTGNGKATITLVQEDPKYYLDLNYYINGTSYVTGLDEAVKADVYINGVLVASNTDDYYTMHPNGTKYKIVAKPKTGYALLSGSNICEGTINNTHSYCEFSLGKKYTVTVNPNNGTSTIVTTKLWSQIYRLPDAPVKKGYTFTNWVRTS